MERIGKYIVHKSAVTSGYARIFFCQDPDLQIPVAIKLFAPRHSDEGLMSTGQWALRFQAEARALAQFDHPHIVAIKTMDYAADGRPFFVMPYMAAHLPYEIGKDADGPDLPERDQPRRVPLSRALALLRQVSLALAALHRRGMVHRQVRPTNILLTAREGGQAKLADFSMVKLAERNPPLPDHWMGPTDYCAPEQRENASGVGPQADVYSLGVLAFRLLTGTRPDPALDSARLPDGAPTALADLVAAATASDPGRRPAHAAVFLQTIETLARERIAKPTVQVVSVRRSNSARIGTTPGAG